MDGDLGAKYWHWLFHLQPDLPERLAGADVEGYLRYFLEKWTYAREGLEPSAIAEYVRAFSQPGRAALRLRRLPRPPRRRRARRGGPRRGPARPQPLLALWGADGVMGTTLPLLDMWREYADDVRGRAIERCGHFVPEERPAEVAGGVAGASSPRAG